MNAHKNARLTVRGRALLVHRVVHNGQRPVDAAQAMGVSARTAYKWLAHYRAQGQQRLHERTSRPARCPHHLSEATRRRIVALRLERRIYRAISRAFGIPGGGSARAPVGRPESAVRA